MNLRFPLPTVLRPLRTPVLCLAFLACGCMFAHDGGGSDTETLTGIVTAPNGSPAARTLVKLIPSNYDPSYPDTALIRRAITDDSGRFRFEELNGKASFNVIAGNAAEKSWAYAPGVKAGGEGENLTLAIAKVFLFELHTENYQGIDSGIAYFPGTDILARCDGVTFSTVDSVPMGALRFIVKSRTGWAHDTTLASALVVDTAKVIATKNEVRLYP